MLLQEDGNVGIGTAAPTQMLEVRGTEAAIRIHDTYSNVNQSLLLLGSDLHASNTKDSWIKFFGGAATNDRTWSIGHNGNAMFRFNYLGTRATAPSGGTTVLNLDGINNRVGIGTAAPGYPLTVKFDGAVSYNGATDLNGESIMSLEGTDADQEAVMIRWANNGNMNNYFGVVQEGASAQGDFVWTSYGGSSLHYAERMRLTAGGNVGIGTNAPDSKLEINTPTTNAHLHVLKLTQNSWSSSQGKIKSIVWDDLTNPVGGIGMSYDGSKTSMHFHSFYNGGYKTESDELMTILGDGNVGIGTTTPGAPLDVYRAGRSGYANPIIDASSLAASGDAYIRAEVGAFADAELGFVGKNNNATWITGYMLNGQSYWQLYQGGTGAVMTATTSGKVGIGTTAPDAHKLTVVGGDDAEGTVHFHQNVATNNPTLYIQQVGEGGNAGNTTGLLIKCDGQNAGLSHLIRAIGTNSNVNGGTDVDAFVVRNDGNVGIGTSSPSAKLHVKSGELFLERSAGTYGLQVYADNSGSYLKASANDLQLWVGSTPAEKMRITQGGNVGIGTATPVATLHVKVAGNVWEDSLLLEHNSGDTGWNIHPENNTRNAIWFGYNADTSVALTSQVASAKMVIEGTTGRVGIGTTTPGKKLDVVGDIRLSINSFLYWGATGTRIVGNADYMRFNTGSVDALSIDSSQRVGIGTIAPTSTLSVGHATSNAASIRVFRSNSLSGTYMEMGTTGGSGMLNCQGGSIAFKLNGTTNSQLCDNGNWGFKYDTAAHATYDFQIGSYSIAEDRTLAILGDNMRTATLRLADENDNYGFDIRNNGASSRLEFVRHSNNSTGTVALVIERDTGEVGIGTTAPGAKLHVNGGNIQIESTGDPQISFDEGTVEWAVGVKDSDNSFRIADNPTIGTADRIIIDSSGYIGLGGTPMSGYRLYSEGHNRFTGICDVAVNSNCNLRVNGATHSGETWDGAILMKKSGASPGDATTNEVAIWAEEISNIVELRCMDDDQNRTSLSSHIDGKWCYKSDNTKTGKSVVIHMEDLVKAVEEHLGASFSEIIEGN
jgi:hypothetical protein